MRGSQYIDGVVLAAGRSRRMGRSKAQLEAANGQTFIEHAVHRLREAGCRYVLAVVNDAEDWTARLADVSGAAVVVNDRENSQQIDSIRLAMDKLPEDSGAMVVLPVDYPEIRTETIAAVIDEFRRASPLVVVASYRGELGHPVLFSRSVYSELLEDLPNGAETLVREHRCRMNVEVDDPGVVQDVDTPDAYEEYLNRSS